MRIALTHAHGDHIGSLDELAAALPGVEVLISARDARLLAKDKSLDPGEPQAKLRGSYPGAKTADAHPRAGRHGRLARGRRGARPHARARRLLRPPRRHAALRRRVHDARRRRHHREDQPALPARRHGDLAPRRPSSRAPAPCARSSRPGWRPATARSSRRPRRGDGRGDRQGRREPVPRAGLDTERVVDARGRDRRRRGPRRASRWRGWPAGSASGRRRSTTTSTAARRAPARARPARRARAHRRAARRRRRARGARRPRRDGARLPRLRARPPGLYAAGVARARDPTTPSIARPRRRPSTSSSPCCAAGTSRATTRSTPRAPFRSAVHGFVALEAAGGFGIPVDVDESFERLVGDARRRAGYRSMTARSARRRAQRLGHQAPVAGRRGRPPGTAARCAGGVGSSAASASSSPPRRPRRARGKPSARLGEPPGAEEDAQVGRRAERAPVLVGDAVLAQQRRPAASSTSPGAATAGESARRSRAATPAARSSATRASGSRRS